MTGNPGQLVVLAKMESFDQLQLLRPEFKEKLVYEITQWDEKTKTKKTKYELTYIGIKQLILELSQKGQGMQIIPGSDKVERKSVDTSDPKQDVWYAEIKYRNVQTGHETWGVSEASVFPWGNYPVIDPTTGKKKFENQKLVTEWKQQYDEFGRTACVAKATRNALRQQLPEMAIQLFVENAIKQNKDSVQKVDDTDDGIDWCKCPIRSDPDQKKRLDGMKLDGTCHTCQKPVRRS